MFGQDNDNNNAFNPLNQQLTKELSEIEQELAPKRQNNGEEYVSDEQLKNVIQRCEKIFYLLKKLKDKITIFDHPLIARLHFQYAYANEETDRKNTQTPEFHYHQAIFYFEKCENLSADNFHCLARAYNYYAGYIANEKWPLAYQLYQKSIKAFLQSQQNHDKAYDFTSDIYYNIAELFNEEKSIKTLYKNASSILREGFPSEICLQFIKNLLRSAFSQYNPNNYVVYLLLSFNSIIMQYPNQLILPYLTILNNIANFMTGNVNRILIEGATSEIISELIKFIENSCLDTEISDNNNTEDNDSDIESDNNNTDDQYSDDEASSDEESNPNTENSTQSGSFPKYIGSGETWQVLRNKFNGLTIEEGKKENPSEFMPQNH